jgi:hypothetical protein
LSKFTVAAAPALLFRAERCDARDQAAIEHAVASLGVLDQAARRSRDALGLRLHVIAWELRGPPEASAAALAWAMDASVISLRDATGYRAIVEAWPRPPKDPFDGAFPRTDVPMLLLNGDVDPMQTRERADATKERYTASRHTLVHLPNAGQGLLAGNAGACARDLVRAFLRSPTKKLDTGCRTTTNPLAFSDARLAELFGTANVWDN